MSGRGIPYGHVHPKSWRAYDYDSIPRDCWMMRCLWHAGNMNAQDRANRVPLDQRPSGDALAWKAKDQVALENATTGYQLEAEPALGRQGA
jgi:hypothetical protein